MSTELSNGVIIPEEYSDDWYDEMSINLRKLNDVITAASDNATDIQRLDTDKANQSDFTALSGRVSQNETDIIALQTAVSGALKREIVQTLPTQDISTTTIYMIRNTTTSGDNIYDEYMYINNLWELIGTSATDFSNYYTKTEIDTLLSYKASDSDVVHKSGNETIAGDKNFKGLISTIPDSTLWPINTQTTDDITFLGDSVVHVEQRGSGNLTDLSNGAWNIANLGVGCFFFRNNNGTDIRYKNFAQNTVNRIYVVSNGNRQLNNVTPETDNTYSLGDSTRRWKQINGLNPSSLGMPDLSNGVDISSYITVNGGNKESFYTPTVNGWISVALTRTGGANMAVMLKQGNFASSGHNITQENGTTTCNAMLPVKGGVQVSINSALADGIHFAYFYPCQGNI